MGLRISFADRVDETSELADYICPYYHYLESWNDANPKVGHYSLTQPTIAPILFKGNRTQGHTLRLRKLGWLVRKNQDYHSFIQNHWEKTLFPHQSKESNFREFWNTSLQYVCWKLMLMHL